MKPRLSLLLVILLSSCAGLDTQPEKFIGTWKMRDTGHVNYFIRVYPNGWYAQWPNPVGTTAWAKLEGSSLVWGSEPYPTLTRREKVLTVDFQSSARSFDLVSDVDAPPTDLSTPGDL